MPASYLTSYRDTPVSVASMRWVLMSVSVAILAAACTTVSPEPGSATTAPIQVPPQLVDYRTAIVEVGDRRLLLAIADSPSLRAQGLMGVTDLRDLDGMLFFWRHDGDAFWMKNTVILLDIVWFFEDGTFAGRASMVPCTQDPCPTYAPDTGLNFRFAIEANRGDLDFVDESTVIVYSD